MTKSVVMPEVGQRFTRWTVLENGRFIAIKDRQRLKSSLCRCDCGEIKEVADSYLRTGNCKSCGCLQKHKASSQCYLMHEKLLKHGHSRVTADGKRETEFTAWYEAKARCTRPHHRAYGNYGGRGIKMCERWIESYDDFLADMGRKPTPCHSLERLDNSKGYGPENCAWATRESQANNTRTNRYITIEGVTMTAAQWGRKTGVKGKVILDRINRLEWIAYEAVNAPVGQPRGSLQVKSLADSSDNRASHAI